MPSQGYKIGPSLPEKLNLQPIDARKEPRFLHPSQAPWATKKAKDKEAGRVTLSKSGNPFQRKRELQQNINASEEKNVELEKNVEDLSETVINVVPALNPEDWGIEGGFRDQERSVDVGKKRDENKLVPDEISVVKG